MPRWRISNIYFIWLANGIVRAPITTLGHVTFSAMWGYPLALKKLKRKNSTALLWLGLLGAMAGHGLFDFLAFQQSDSSVNIPALIGLIALFCVLIAFFVILLRRGQKDSPFKDKNAWLLIACPNCQTHIPYYSDFCSACGTKLAENKSIYPEFCGKCGTEVSRETNFCPSCGSRIIKKPGSVNEHR